MRISKAIGGAWLSVIAAAVGGLAQPAAAEVDDAAILAAIEADRADTVALADALWDLAELGYQETESAALLKARLAAAGFAIEDGVAGIPTAFVARYRRGGGGGGVVGLLAEYDALPGLSQDRTPERRPIPGRRSAHACGHNLFGAGSVTAALAVKAWMDAAGVDGEIRLYGTPAEEGGSGKVYMARAGLFDDVDAVLHWHPDDVKSASPTRNLANRSARFVFTGVAAHAAGAPDRGRSALDGVEAMNFMTNLMREHMPQEARIHYVITRGGAAPNVVPAEAEAYYYVRHPDVAGLEALWSRVETAARAAAMGTGTEVAVEVMHGNHPLLPNDTLQRRLYAHMLDVGGVEYSAEERDFAATVVTSFAVEDAAPGQAVWLGEAAQISAYRPRRTYGSTDVGDVSWAAPTSACAPRPGFREPRRTAGRPPPQAAPRSGSKAWRSPPRRWR